MQNKTIAYLRVSTVEQDLEKNKADILTFANNRDFGKVKFVEEKVSGTKNWKDRKIKQVIDVLNKGDRLIVPEFSRLGRSMLEIMEMSSILKDREVNVYAVKGEWELNGSRIKDRNTISVRGTVIEYKSEERKYSPRCGSRMFFKKRVKFYLPG